MITLSKHFNSKFTVKISFCNMFIYNTFRSIFIHINGGISHNFQLIDKGTTFYFSIEVLSETGRSGMGKEVEVR
jgi:hypothetical protein